MTYQKDPKITYNQMAMYIDENIYKENNNEALIYEYMYHIIYMLSKHYRYFKHNDDYDRFALFMASRIYMRYQSKDQFVLKEDGTPKLEKVKSVMNYIKQTIGVYKIKYQKKEYSQTISKEEYPLDVEYSFDNILNTYINKLNICEFGLMFDNIDKTCKHFLKSIPYKENSVMWLNIYLSVMLTFLNRVTVIPQVNDNNILSKTRYKEYQLTDLYNELSKQEPILYHLPEHMSNYIDVLSKQLKHILAKDLTEIYHTNISSDIILYNYNYEGVQDTYADN